MKNIQFLLLLSLAALASDASAGHFFSLHPSPVFPGQPAFLRIDDTDGCFEFDEHQIRQNGGATEVEIWVSDFLMNVCQPQHVTPVLIPLGTFEAGAHAVQVFECGLIPIDPCGEPTLLTLDVGAMPRPTTIPAFGWIALLLSCSGILALAFTDRAEGTRR